MIQKGITNERMDFPVYIVVMYTKNETTFPTHIYKNTPYCSVVVVCLFVACYYSLQYYCLLFQWNEKMETTTKYNHPPAKRK